MKTKTCFILVIIGLSQNTMIIQIISRWKNER